MFSLQLSIGVLINLDYVNQFDLVTLNIQSAYILFFIFKLFDINFEYYVLEVLEGFMKLSVDYFGN